MSACTCKGAPLRLRYYTRRVARRSTPAHGCRSVRGVFVYPTCGVITQKLLTYE
jgi:hypothetical protein